MFSCLPLCHCFEAVLLDESLVELVLCGPGGAASGEIDAWCEVHIQQQPGECVIMVDEVQVADALVVSHDVCFGQPHEVREVLPELLPGQYY